MKRKNLLAVGLTMTLIPAISWMSFGGTGITSSPHDFSGKGWNPTKQICVVCHTPHKATTNTGSLGLLWNRALSNAVYTLYNSDTIKYTPGQPDGATKLCLSCHDGTLAIDNFGPYTGGSYFIPNDKKIGGNSNLSDSHPVSFVYDSALAVAVKTLKDPSSPSGLGGSITDDLLRKGKVQCVSCHDVHNRLGNDDLLVKKNDGSSLCLTCHNF